MTWGAVGGAAVGVVGGMLGGGSAKRAAKRAAKAQVRAAEIAAESAKFKPYNITTGLGSATFDTKKNTASYQLDGRLKGFQDTMFDMGRSAMPTNLDPTQAGNTLFGRYQQMLAPAREQQFAQLQNSEFNNGTLGLAVGATKSGGMGNANPALQAYLNSTMQQDQQLAMTADENARRYLDQDISRSQGLFNYGIGLEAPGQAALDAGINIGSKQASAGANAGQMMLTGATNAANTRMQGSQNYIDNMSNILSGGISAFKTHMQPKTGYTNNWYPGNMTSGGTTQPTSTGGYTGNWYPG